MKRVLCTLGGALCLAALAYVLYFELMTRPSEALLSRPEGRLEWLRREFQLTDAQFARITELHDAYGPVCSTLCQRIVEANTRLESLVDGQQSVTPEIEAALFDCASVRRDCNAALLKHAYAVAAEMPPESGKRYLHMMTSRLTQPAPWFSRSLSQKPD